MKNHKILAIGAAAAVLLMAGCGAGSDTGSDSASPDRTEAAAFLREVKSTRYMTDDSVPAEDVQRILEAGVNAPSGTNAQLWHFSAVTDREILGRISDGLNDWMASAGMTVASDPSVKPMTGIGEAPLAIFVSGREGSELNIGIACQAMSTEAQLLGYGTKIMTSPAMIINGEEQAEYNEYLEIPEDQTVMAVVTVGIPDPSIDESMDGITGASVRNPFDEMVTVK